MDTPANPGNWYQTEEGETFRVLAVDKARGVTDVQFLSGRVEQFDAEAWRALEAIEVEPLEEWHATMDDFLSGRRFKS